jgi:hypothetical protein
MSTQNNAEWRRLGGVAGNAQAGHKSSRKGVNMFNFSEHGVKNKDIFCRIYSDFVDYCKSNFTAGTFSTYCDGEPVFMQCGFEFSYSAYKRVDKSMKKSNPMPTVTYENKTYKLKSRNIEVPDLASMESLSALVWLNKNTVKKGYFKEPALVLPNTITILSK